MESRIENQFGERAQGRADYARALAFARNNRLKFERVYETARKAILAGDSQTALTKCRAALDLLHQEDIYGPAQPALHQLIEAQIERLSDGGPLPPEAARYRPCCINAPGLPLGMDPYIISEEAV
jgi:hypothetical protein